MKLPFTHAGREYALVKHPRYGARPPAEQAGLPWYLRIQRSYRKVGAATVPAKELRARAVELLQSAALGGDPWEQKKLATAHRASLTVQKLASHWAAAHYAGPAHPRPPAAQTRQASWINYALKWWGPKTPASIGPDTHKQYADHQRRALAAAGRTVTGQRAVDQALNCLGNLFTWAVAETLVDANPFATRARYHAPGDVASCNEFMPGCDEELHRLCAVGLGTPAGTVIAAHCIFQALTGLRPGEPSYLRWDAQRGADWHEPGCCYRRLADGVDADYLAVHRLKTPAKHARRAPHGYCPEVRVHPALAAFLAAWRPYARTHWPDSPWWFPNPAAPAEPLLPAGTHRNTLNRALDAWRRALGLPPRRPHALRAYYVRVRRSQGAGDAAIAEELGERTGARIISDIYGEPQGKRGDGLFDWLPAGDVRPVWEKIKMPAGNIVDLAGNRDATLDATGCQPKPAQTALKISDNAPLDGAANAS